MRTLPTPEPWKLVVGLLVATAFRLSFSFFLSFHAALYSAPRYRPLTRKSPGSLPLEVRKRHGCRSQVRDHAQSREPRGSGAQTSSRLVRRPRGTGARGMPPKSRRGGHGGQTPPTTVDERHSAQLPKQVPATWRQPINSDRPCAVLLIQCIAMPLLVEVPLRLHLFLGIARGVVYR